MRKILMSLASIGAVAVVAFSASGAFFSDSETSTGNVFSAGAIDLQIDSTAHYAGFVCQGGVWVDEDNDRENNSRPELAGTECDGTWDSSDLTEQRFFNFTDVKPGDMGENTISMTVFDNDAWACMHIGNMQNNENDLTEPEIESLDVTIDPNGGELAENLHFTAWLDQGSQAGWQGQDEDPEEGDNVWQEATEPLLFTNQSGPASDVLGGKTYALADAAAIGGPLQGDVTNYIGLQWCAGEMTISEGVISCDGSTMGNESQTDSLTADLSFYVEQSRNNPDFSCNDVEWPEESTSQTIEVNSSNFNSQGWFFYNDENDTIDNTLGTFVAGPGTPIAGTGSSQMTVSGSQRRNLATYGFSGTELADITALSFSTYQPSATSTGNQAIFLNFNVDFDGSDTWQRRLVYVPSANGSVSQDTWQTWDAINSGNALWSWSGFVANGNKWPDGDTDANRPWSEIVTQFPNARIRVTDSWFGFRAGEPYPAGFTGNVDNFTLGVNGHNVTYDFEQ